MEKSIFEVMQKKQFESKQGVIAYWCNDFQSTRETLIFLHGLTADHTLFERQIAYFYEHYNLFCWDAPAHGKSRPYLDFSYNTATKDLFAILEKENIPNAFFIGQSMGGYVAQTFIKYYPEKVKGFIGIDTTPFGLSYYSKSDLWWLKQIEWMCMCFPHSLLVKSIAGSATYTKEAYKNMSIALSTYSKKELCRLMGIGYADFLKENCMLDIKCPVLILIGEHDNTGKVKQYCNAWSQQTLFPLHVISEAAHNSNFDNSEAVNHEIEIFIQTNRYTL